MIIGGHIQDILQVIIMIFGNPYLLCWSCFLLPQREVTWQLFPSDSLTALKIGQKNRTGG